MQKPESPKLAQLDGLMRHWPCVIFSQRPDFCLDFASPNIEELTGIPSADWLRQPPRFWELIHEADAGGLQLHFKRAAQNGSILTNTFRIRHAMTGRVAHILEQRRPVLGADGRLTGHEVVWLDVTRQTIAEKRLAAAAWKETLAVLTLGLAHDFRNIMAGVHSLSETFLHQLEARHPFTEGLSLIRKNSLQASQLIQRMISLHVGQTGERGYHNLNEVVTDLMELMGKILPRRVVLRPELVPVTLPVYIDAVEFRQVVINLLLNAADAMPKGGELTVRTSRHEEFPVLESFKGVAPRPPCVCVSIQDTGIGIKERHLPALFDPFFTTKSKGSGLGLYNARIAMEKHHGAISVQSGEGIGATFQLWLPQADFSESTREDAQKGPVSRRSILLLGRAGEWLEKTAEFLRSHNYHVVLAVSPDEVPPLLQSGDYQFAGILLQAEPNDPALAAWLDEARQHKKDLRVILKLAGCNQDDVDTQVLNRADLLLNSDLPEADILGKMKTFFEAVD